VNDDRNHKAKYSRRDVRAPTLREVREWENAHLSAAAPRASRGFHGVFLNTAHYISNVQTGARCGSTIGEAGRGRTGEFRELIAHNPWTSTTWSIRMLKVSRSMSRGTGSRFLLTYLATAQAGAVVGCAGEALALYFHVVRTRMGASSTFQ